MKGLKGIKGFTLLEVLIVIVILAVLAGLAIPIYASNVEKSKAQEAIQNLEAIRGSMLRYFASNGTYATATLRTTGGAAAATDIDVDPNNPTGGQIWRFTYIITPPVPTATTFTATATRIAARNTGGVVVGAGADPIPGAGAGTITIQENGVVTRSAIFQ